MHAVDSPTTRHHLAGFDEAPTVGLWWTTIAHADVSDASSLLRAVDRLARQASGFGNER
jgi:hypothetical protein